MSFSVVKCLQKLCVLKQILRVFILFCWLVEFVSVDFLSWNWKYWKTRSREWLGAFLFDHFVCFNLRCRYFHKHTLLLNTQDTVACEALVLILSANYSNFGTFLCRDLTQFCIKQGPYIEEPLYADIIKLSFDALVTWE